MSDCGNMCDTLISVIYTRDHVLYTTNRGKNNVMQ
jgi:hypothetical protein